MVLKMSKKKRKNNALFSQLFHFQNPHTKNLPVYLKHFNVPLRPFNALAVAPWAAIEALSATDRQCVLRQGIHLDCEVTWVLRMHVRHCRKIHLGPVVAGIQRACVNIISIHCKCIAIVTSNNINWNQVGRKS